MRDLEIAKNRLAGHTLCLCRDGECLFGDKRGIAPMMELIASGADLSGYCAADLIVGKAAAFLFIKSGVRAVFAKTLSVFGKETLEKHGVFCEYGTLTGRIVNRAGTDMCPMEKTVLNCSDPEEAYALLRQKLSAPH